MLVMAGVCKGLKRRPPAQKARGYNDRIISPASAACRIFPRVSRGGASHPRSVHMHHLTPRRTLAPKHLQRPARALCALMAVAALSACSGWGRGLPGITSLVTPYKIDIVQGNVVTREQAQALKVGMSRAQVRDVLGSPLLASVFHSDRWEYVFN